MKTNNFRIEFFESLTDGFEEPTEVEHCYFKRIETAKHYALERYWEQSFDDGPCSFILIARGTAEEDGTVLSGDSDPWHIHIPGLGWATKS